MGMPMRMTASETPHVPFMGAELIHLCYRTALPYVFKTIKISIYFILRMLPPKIYRKGIKQSMGKHQA